MTELPKHVLAVPIANSLFPEGLLVLPARTLFPIALNVVSFQDLPNVSPVIPIMYWIRPTHLVSIALPASQTVTPAHNLEALSLATHVLTLWFHPLTSQPVKTVRPESLTVHHVVSFKMELSFNAKLVEIASSYRLIS